MIDMNEDLWQALRLYQASSIISEEAFLRVGLPFHADRQDKKIYILVNDIFIEININLKWALKILCEISEIQFSKRIWVDSLYINLNDLDEKVQKVIRMNEIYEKAERIISWIRQKQNHSDDILKFLHMRESAIVIEEEMR